MCLSTTAPHSVLFNFGRCSTPTYLLFEGRVGFEPTMGFLHGICSPVISTTHASTQIRKDILRKVCFCFRLDLNQRPADCTLRPRPASLPTEIPKFRSSFSNYYSFLRGYLVTLQILKINSFLHHFNALPPICRTGGS